MDARAVDFEHTFEARRCSVGELQSALDALAAEDLTPLFGPQLLERLGPCWCCRTGWPPRSPAPSASAR